MKFIGRRSQEAVIILLKRLLRKISTCVLLGDVHIHTASTPFYKTFAGHTMHHTHTHTHTHARMHIHTPLDTLH